ncbi:hypothetical protein KFL_008210060 [Klebsormidium nitens]|uniref:Protein kinase domain-containing protein n=1 Tax=Klebsormidium nitens TaxID=105231 RepID=A0A1Y1ITV5_KLENI|nr:hypothetical protein KFL_008210060 [Klebsormidium nitens]|eukprot:GAQ91628.1 hypothetical protein KFL_008210060 [Klebsormidium nitens]
MDARWMNGSAEVVKTPFASRATIVGLSRLLEKVGVVQAETSGQGASIMAEEGSGEWSRSGSGSGSWSEAGSDAGDSSGAPGEWLGADVAVKENDDQVSKLEISAAEVLVASTFQHENIVRPFAVSLSGPRSLLAFFHYYNQGSLE